MYTFVDVKQFKKRKNEHNNRKNNKNHWSIDKRF